MNSQCDQCFICLQLLDLVSYFVIFNSVTAISNHFAIKPLNVITDEICAQVSGSFSKEQIVWYKNACTKEPGLKDCSIYFGFDVLHCFLGFHLIGTFYLAFDMILMVKLQIVILK